MTLPEHLRLALVRLNGALDTLDAAVARRVQADAARVDLEDELAAMADDRARLAADLDGVLAREKALVAAGGEVSRRLNRVSATVRAALTAVEARPEGAGAPRPEPPRR